MNSWCDFFLPYLTNGKNSSSILDRSLYKVDRSAVMIITEVSFIVFLVNWYTPSTGQAILLLPNRINEFMDLRPWCFTSSLNQFSPSITWQFTSLLLAVGMLSQEKRIRYYVFLSAWHHWHCIHNITVASGSSICSNCCGNLQADHHRILHKVTSTLVASLKFIYSSVQFSIIFFLYFVVSPLILPSNIPSLYPRNACWLHVLCCSDYPHLFCLNAVTPPV
jgi:hypothetical protein